VTAPSPVVPGSYVEETTVEGGLLDHLWPRTREDWFKLGVGAFVGFLLGRRMR